MVKVIWDDVAKKDLRAAYNYIKERSPQNAEKVRSEVVKNAAALAVHPEIYPLDRFKLNNDGSYRTFKLFSYIISFRVMNDSIRIIRVRHTKQRPLPH